MEYPWYDLVGHDEEVIQGDFIIQCPMTIPQSDSSDKSDEDLYNAIVMSQSCDIVCKKIELVLMCPVWPLSIIKKLNPSLSREKLRKGEIVSLHLLNECVVETETSENDEKFVVNYNLCDESVIETLEQSGQDYKQEYVVADFRNVYSVPIDFLSSLVRDRGGERLRLLPPYREHLSQSFARFIMRVGLPQDIPKFK